MSILLEKTPDYIRNHFAILLLLLNSFSWYFIGRLLVDEIIKLHFQTSALLEAAFPLSIIASAIIGAVVLNKIQKTKLLLHWVLFGTVASLFPLIPIGTSFYTALIVIILLGTSLGIGMPSLLSYFTEVLPIENRGVIGGLTFFLVTASAPVVIFATSAWDLPASWILLGLWRSWSLPIIFIASKSRRAQTQPKRMAKITGLFHDRSFLLYFSAWLMFSLVDGFENKIIFDYIAEDMARFEPIIAGFSALIVGILADRIGRKKVVISGFVSLGLAYAVLGLAPTVWISSLLFIVIDGFAIGSLWTIFTIVVWGELTKSSSEGYYAIGEAPYFLTQLTSILLAPWIKAIDATSAFSLAAFFLFIAVTPLLYAPETLPEKKILERQLKTYTQEALGMKQKVEQKQRH
jgi:MFS family permease